MCGDCSAPLQHRPDEQRGFGFPPLTPDEEKGGALNYILHRLRSAGYGVSFNLYNSANFGVPQVRERVILVCCRDEKRLPTSPPPIQKMAASGCRNGGRCMKFSKAWSPSSTTMKFSREATQILPAVARWSILEAFAGKSSKRGTGGTICRWWEDWLFPPTCLG